MFDFHKYIERLARECRAAAAAGFTPCHCSGVAYLEGVLDRLRTARAFVCIDDVCEESTVQRGGGWYKRRVFTVFLLHRYDVRRLGDLMEKMDLCRELLRQFHSRMIHDADNLGNRLTYLDVANVRSRELGGDFLNGCTGLYFMVAIDEPTDLQFRPDEWQIQA